MSASPRLAALVLFALSFAGVPALADTLSTFDFTGMCADCTGVSTGELVLTGYTTGAAIDPGNFVSFTYKGTNTLPGFSVLAGGEFGIGGSVGQPLPGPQDFYLFAPNGDFTTSTDGFWCAGGGCVADYGPSHRWSIEGASTDVPEPTTIVLLVGGLLGLGIVRRR